MSIPKIIFQKSKVPQPDYVVDMINQKIPDDWEYRNYINGDEISFFKENPLEEFPLIEKVFNSYPRQQHKSDLFRYYFMYIYGGVYLDSDAMIYTNIIDIIKTYDFVSVSSINPKNIFNGFICSMPKHPIIYKALQNAYQIEVEKLSYFQRLCENLYEIVYDPSVTYPNIKIYPESFLNDNLDIGCTMDQTEIIIRHYHAHKIIPRDVEFKPDKITKIYVYIGTSTTDTKTIHLDRNYPFNSTFTLMNHPFKDTFDIMFDKTKYANKLVIRRTDEVNPWGYPHCGFIQF